MESWFHAIEQQTILGKAAAKQKHQEEVYGKTRNTPLVYTVCLDQ